MRNNEIENLERYFRTENEYWNDYTFELLCEVLKQDNFEDPETPLRLFEEAVGIFTEMYETPLKAIREFAAEVDKAGLNEAQRIFVYEWVYKFIIVAEYENIDLEEIQDLLKCQTERLKNEKIKDKYNKPLTEDIRNSLKEVLQKELENLPDTLKELGSVQRLNILCKLIPFVLPKVETVTHRLGEPGADAESNWV